MPAVNVNDFLIKSFQDGLDGGTAIKECKTEESAGAVLERFDDEFSRGFVDKKADPWKIQNVDLDYVFERTLAQLPHNPAGIFARNPSASELREAAIAIKASNWDQYFDRCVQTTFSQLACQESPYNLADCFTRVDRNCSDFDNRRVCEIIEPRILPPCDEDSEDDMEVLWVGLGDTRCWKMPRLCTSKIGFALHRNLRCVGGTEQVSDLMDGAIRRGFGREDEKSRVRIMFGLDGCLGCSYPFQLDDVIFQSGYQASQGGQWSNVVCGAQYKLTGCNDALLCAIEQIWEKARDPFSCDPVDCPGDFQLAIPWRCQINAYRHLIAAGSQLFHVADDCESEITTPRPARDGWSADVKYSAYMKDELTRFYRTCTFECPDGAGGVTEFGPATNDATAEAWSANTYLVSKNFKDTFSWMVDFDIITDELSGTDTEAYLERGILFRRVYRYKRGPGWSRPWMTVLVRGFDASINPIV